MGKSVLQFTGAVFLAGSLLLLVFTATRVWRRRSVKSALLLAVDFIVASVLPLVAINWFSSGLGAVERLILMGFLFYLTTCVCYMLFPYTCERYVLPVASFYLVLSTLQSLLTFLGNSSLELQLTTFVYRLMDDITVATLCELFIAELAPACKHIVSRLVVLASCRLSNSMSRNFVAIGGDGSTASPSHIRENGPPSSPDRFLTTGLNFLRQRKYKSCIESCDTGVENIIVEALLRLCATRLESPMTIEEQLSSLQSNGVPIRGKRIIQLRRLRNSLTVSCGEGTLNQAKWAMKVLRMTMKRIGEFGKAISSSLDRE